jgi:periplasmic divalent cation tolerance protein
VSDGARVVLSSAPDRATAWRIARALVEEERAACVNLVPGARSIYRWRGAIEEADEFLLVIKTTAAAFPGLAARLAELHPYDVPEVIALAPDAIPESYRAWLDGAVRTV